MAPEWTCEETNDRPHSLDPEDLVEFADRGAHQADISRSQVISQALAEAEARHEKCLAEDGYRLDADEVPSNSPRPLR